MSDGSPDLHASFGDLAEGAARRAVAAFAQAVRLSCLAAQHPPGRPAPDDVANRAVAAHRDAHAWAEEAVRRAGRVGRGRSTRA